MATYTTNYNLKKPAETDFILVGDFNDNADIIDAELKKRPVIGEDGKLSDDLLPDLAAIYEPKGAADSAVSAHNTSTNAHQDIRANLTTHTSDTTVHVTAAEKSTWSGKVSGSTKVNTTLSASGWTSDNKYTLSNTNITATCAVELLPRESGGITQEQYEALTGAMIVGGTQAAGSIQLVALGDAPTSDIPVTLIIRRDL